MPPYTAESGSFTTSILATYYTNCQYLGLTTIYSAQLQSDDPVTCGNILCGTDATCTHFSWLGPVPGRSRGTCSLRSSPGTGGDWYSPFLLPTQSVCGFIPTRANAPLPTPTVAPTTPTHPTTESPEPTASCESNCDGMCVGNDTIQTPSYPAAYSPNLNCTFTLTASEPTAYVALGISKIFFTSPFDMLIVFGSDQSLLFSYSQESGTFPVFLTFVGSINGIFISGTDGSNKRNVKQSAIGLAASYFASLNLPETPSEYQPTTMAPTTPSTTVGTTTPPPTTMTSTIEPSTTIVPPQPTAGCESNCDEMCVGDDTVQTPGYPAAYAPNLNCTFTLTASEPTAYVALGISNIVFATPFDNLKVFGHNQSVLLAYPGGNLPAFMSSVGRMSGLFISANRDTKRKNVKQTAIGVAATFFASTDVPVPPSEYTTTTLAPSTTRQEPVITCTMSGIDCGICTDGTTGIIQSPNFPSDYGNLRNCIYTLTSGSPILLSFSNFKLETNFDFVSVYDGPSTSSPLLTKNNDYDIPPSVTSTGNVMTIHFTSDVDNSGVPEGTTAAWSAVYQGTGNTAVSTTQLSTTTFLSSTETPGPATQAPQPFITCTITDGVNCNGSCDGGSTMGSIRSPIFPIQSPEGVFCTYTIMGSGPITLEFNLFDLEDFYDSIVVTDSDEQFIGIFTAQNRPPPIIKSTGNTMTVKFMSESRNTNNPSGFVGIWEGYLFVTDVVLSTRAPPSTSTVRPEPTAVCESSCEGMCVGNDTVQTPGYPAAYATNLFCTFTLIASEPSAYVALGIPNIFFATPFDTLQVFGSDQSILFTYPGGTLPTFMSSVGYMRGLFISAMRNAKRRNAKQTAIGISATFFASADVPEPPPWYQTTPTTTTNTPSTTTTNTPPTTMTNTPPPTTTSTPAPVTQAPQSGITCTVAGANCGSCAITTAGLIQSPNFPRQYPDSVYCTYHLTGSRPITIRFTTFILEEDKDFLYVSDSNRVVVGLYTGYELPSSFTSTGNTMTLEFMSGPGNEYDPPDLIGKWEASLSTSSRIAMPELVMSSNQTKKLAF